MRGVRELLLSTGSLEGVRRRLEDAWSTAPTALMGAVGRARILGHLAGAWDASPEGPLGFAANEDPFQSPFDEAVDFFRQRKVVTPRQLALLSEEEKVEAFWVAGIADRRLLEEVRGSIDKAIAEGGTFAEFLGELDQATAAAGRKPFGLHHAQVMFRNQTQSAYMAGRYQQMVRHTARRPIWVYHAQPGARPSHAAQDGVRARWDSPYWASWYPLNGHGCRCGVSSETEEEAAAAGYTEDPPADLGAQPDKGWARSPALAQEAREAAEEVVEKTGELGLMPSTMLDARRLAGATRRTLSSRQKARIDALARARDSERLALIRGRLPLKDAHLAEMLGQSTGINFFPPGFNLDPDEPLVEVAMYSQDLPATHALARRLVYEPRWTGLRGRLGVQARLSAVRGWDPSWDSATEALDRGLGDLLTDRFPVAWSTEASLVLRPAAVGDAPELLEWLTEQMQDSGPNPVPLSWGTADIRWRGPLPDLAGPDGDVQPAVQVVWLNSRDVEGGWSAVTLSPDRPLDGWESRPVVVNSSLAEFLRSIQ